MVARKAATLQLLSEGRFRLGPGSGENLNEHVDGAGWPAAHVRLVMLEEVVQITGELFDGGYVNQHGTHSTWTTPGCGTCLRRVSPMGVAVPGGSS